MDVNEVCTRIRKALRKRSGKAWSVTHGRGTAYGWIRIKAPPSRQGAFGRTSEDDRVELAKLLALDTVHPQGVSIPSSSDYYAEHLARAQGEVPTVRGVPYWD